MGKLTLDQCTDFMGNRLREGDLVVFAFEANSLRFGRVADATPIDGQVRVFLRSTRSEEQRWVAPDGIVKVNDESTSHD